MTRKKKLEKMLKEWRAEKERPQLWYRATARCLGLKPNDVKATIECMMAMAAYHMKKHGSFKLAGYINMKLKVIPAKPARKGVNQFTKAPHDFKEKPASKTVRISPMKKLKRLVN